MENQGDKGMNCDEIKARIFSAMLEEERSRDKTVFYVTEICYDCLRYAYYSITEGRSYGMRDLITTFIGKAVHQIQILDKNELEVSYKHLKGRVDDYENGILLEKKSCRRIPDRPLEHHIKQVEYYKVLLEESGYPVNKIFIAYINVANSKLEVFEVKSRSSEVIKKEIDEKTQELMKALALSKPPERKFGWLCNYCPFFERCIRDD